MDINNKNNTLTRDELIVDYIKDQLEEKMQASAMDINVMVRDGAVSLSGFVDVLAEKKFAENVARSIDGVKKVENNLTISMDGNFTDKHMEKEIREKLFTSDSKDKIGGVGVKVNDGVANLVGHVSTLKNAHMAMNFASGIRGVKDVVNNIDIESIGKYDDITINNTIHQQINSKDITCDVNGGVVKLMGFVNSKYESEFAKDIAMDVEGVRKVKNMLKVRKR